MSQYTEDGKILIPPKGIKVTSREWDDICRENDCFEKYHPVPVYEFGGGKVEFWEEVKFQAGESPKKVKRRT
jgi:hypothetical protein